MNHVASRVVSVFLLLLFVSSIAVDAQNVYELRQLTDQEWRAMSTAERLNALNTTNTHAMDQEFIGDFGRYGNLFQQWGSDYYEMDYGYENYSFRGFENYNIMNNRRDRWFYNQFGDRMTRLRSAGKIWGERVNDDGTWDTLSGSNQVGPSGFSNAIGGIGVSGVWVAQESTDDWAVSAVGARALRKKFSPLTFSLPNYNGMAIDFQSANYQASFVSSTLFGVNVDSPKIEGASDRFSRTMMLRGGQIRRKFGALTLGFNYANMYQLQPNRDGGQTLKGTVNDLAPTPHRYLVRIVDDSPWDGDGPLVHDVKLIVNGRYRPDIVPTVIMDSLEREKVTVITDVGQSYYLDPDKLSYWGGASGSQADRLAVTERRPKFADYLYYDDLVKGKNIKTVAGSINVDLANEYYQMVDVSSGPVSVNGNDYVVYIFDLSSLTGEELTRVQAEITVENDYKIQCSEVFQAVSKGERELSIEQYTTANGYTSSYWKTMAQADGNVKDGSNLRTVTVDFAYEVANTIYGLNASFNYLGFHIDAEYVVNTHHYQFADGPVNNGVQQVSDELTPRNGKYSSISDNAYYVTMQKQWSKLGFAGEIFKMGKFYRPNMMVYSNQAEGGSSINSKADYVDMTMIADNDDNDQYPDVMYAPQSMTIRPGSATDPDGVFPGKDEDKDGVPDTDKNMNGIIDYDEPFLMLDTDPDEFLFGDDFNNNTIPDYLEDDFKFDTPYDLDRQGYHLVLSYALLDNLNLRVGSFKTRGVGVDNRTFNDYFKTDFTYNVLDIGSFYAEYHLERIKDNIADQYYIPISEALQTINTSWSQGARYRSDLYFDELEYRNSLVNRLNVHAEMRPVAAVSLETQLRYENNSQVEGTMYDSFYQPENKIRTIAISNKIAYTKAFGNFTFSPGFKVRLYKKDYDVLNVPRDHYLMTIPIVYLRYRVSDNTHITFGMQGFTGFETSYTDYVLSRNNYTQRNSLLQIENLTDYRGFQVWGAAGFQYEQVDFDEAYRQFEEFKSTSLFMRVWVGN